MGAGTGFNQSTQPGMSPSELARLEYLETNEYKITYWASITTNSGTITPPTGSTIILDALSSGVDAIVETIVNGQPSGFSPVTGGGAYVTVSSFNAGGDYTLSGTPSATPVALLYVITIPADQYQNLDLSKIIMPEYNNPVVQSINNGDTSHSPSSDAVYDALALKANIIDVGYIVSSRFYAALTPADSTNYYPVYVFASGVTAGGARSRHKVLKSGTKIDVNWTHSCTAGTNEGVTLSVTNITTATTIVITTAIDMSVATANNQYLNNSLSYTQGDLIEAFITTPAWATNPAALVFNVDLNFR